MLIGFMSLHKQAVALTLADLCEDINISGSSFFFIATVCKCTLGPFVLSAPRLTLNGVAACAQMKVCSV